MFDKRNGERYDGFEKRVGTLRTLMLLGMVILAMRLWDLQVIRWAEFRGKSDNNSLRIQHLTSPRGIIAGRDGDATNVVLADNRAAGDLVFVLAECDQNLDLIVSRIESIVRIDGDALLDEILKYEKQPHRQIMIKKDLPSSQLARVEEYAHALPGVFTVVRPHRRYLYGKTASQLLGYLGEIGPGELKAQGSRYRMGDLVGRAGIERIYESLLHGIDGQMLVTKYAVGRPQLRTDPYGNPYVEVDSFGHSLVEEQVQEPIPGGWLQITLDIGLQRKAEELLEGEEGAIVVLDSDTGAVIALASTPGYDPAVFIDPGKSDARKEALTGKPNRMIHRAYQEVYAPGSVLKIVLAVAALEEGVIDGRTTYTCSGGFKITPTGRTWRCWKKYGHGTVDVVDALAYSCDVFFYTIGLQLDIHAINKWADRFGFGQLTGIELPGEVRGLIPSPDWKRERMARLRPDDPYEQRWYPGDTVNLSIGQGAATVTPLQTAVMMAAMINGGHRIRPYLKEDSPTARSGPFMSEDTIRLVQKGIRKCVEKGPPAPTGTGHAAAVEGFSVLGKTGTAQVVSLVHHEQYETEEDIPKHLRDHAWFVAGVNDRQPAIAISVLVEHGHHGSRVAAPMARELIEYFYDNRTSTLIKVAKREGGES
ncbi:MAG: penicillin-binding protein 2 [Candidatus Hydrogenedentes bacterium]|nr:penicillin-binding protein 2 [Candidatus Hydrogenedentota bacterium]